MKYLKKIVKSHIRKSQFDDIPDMEVAPPSDDSSVFDKVTIYSLSPQKDKFFFVVHANTTEYVYFSDTQKVKYLGKRDELSATAQEALSNAVDVSMSELPDNVKSQVNQTLLPMFQSKEIVVPDRQYYSDKDRTEAEEIINELVELCGIEHNSEEHVALFNAPLIDLQALKELVDEHDEGVVTMYAKGYAIASIEFYLRSYSIDVYNAAMYLDIEVDEVDDVYHGEFDRDEEFAQYIVYEYSEFVVPSYVVIDWQETADNLLYEDYVEYNGHYFRTA